MSCGTDCCKGVGASDGGGTAGEGKIGVVCKAVEISHLREMRFVIDRRNILVNAARKTLYWTSGMRWSEESGSMIVPSGQRGVKVGAGSNNPLADALRHEAKGGRWRHRCVPCRSGDSWKYWMAPT